MSFTVTIFPIPISILPYGLAIVTSWAGVRLAFNFSNCPQFLNKLTLNVQSNRQIVFK